MISSDNINETLTRLESLYGAGLDKDDYSSATMSDCIDAAAEDLEYYKEDYHFSNLHNKAEAPMKEMSWISSMAYYTGDSVVIFDNFPNTPEISAILLSFTKLTYSESINDSLYKKLIAYLIYIDDEHVEFRFSNSYRCVKLIVMMLLYHSTVHASIMCRFVIQQMAASIGIR